MFAFLRPPVVQAGQVLVPDWLRVRQGLRSSVKRIQTQYHQAPVRRIVSGHLLHRLLMSINTPFGDDPLIFADRVADSALETASMFRLTSPLHQGRVHQNVFFGDGMDEVILATISLEGGLVNPGDWRQYRPIRVLYYPGTALDLKIPMGRGVVAEGGVAVIEVNLPLLASGWRGYRLSQGRNEGHSQSALSYLSAYALPGMLDSQLDLALVNRLLSRFFDIPVADTHPAYPFYLIDWYQEVDSVQRLWLDRARTKHWRLEHLLGQLPVAMADRFDQVIALPGMYWNRQVGWAVALSRLPLYAFLVQFNAVSGNPANRGFLTQLKQGLRALEGGRYLDRMLPVDRQQEVKAIIDQAIRPYLD